MATSLGIRNDLLGILTIVAEDLSAALRTGVGRLHRRFRSERGSGDLGDAALAVLAYLAKDGPKTLKALSEYERVTPATMSQTVNRLSADGYVERNRDPEDGRRVLFTATATGVALVHEAREQSTAWLDVALAQLDDEEREVLARAAILLRRLADG
jgi:DNA-binding MarR family transcriptional regulator